MSKTITLRLADEVYDTFRLVAIEDNRPISNLIETLALKKLKEDMFVNDFEMEEILNNKSLISKLKKGSLQAKNRKGKLIG